MHLAFRPEKLIQTRFQGAEAEKIWRLPPSDQASVLSFLAQSMKRIESLNSYFSLHQRSRKAPSDDDRSSRSRREKTLADQSEHPMYKKAKEMRKLIYVVLVGCCLLSISRGYESYSMSPQST